MPLREAFLALQKRDFAEARRMASHFDLPLTFHASLVKGLAETGYEDWQAAARTFLGATKAFPGHAPFWFNLGVAQENLGDDKNALASFIKSLEIDPNNGEAHGNASNILCRFGQGAEAETHALAALALGVPRAMGLNSLGLALARQGKHDEAERAFLEAHQLAPNDPLIAHSLGNLMADRLRFEEAWPYFAEAKSLTARPEIRLDEGLARLLAGDYEIGWNLYEARLELPKAIYLPRPLPRFVPGAPPQKIIILAEQGFGDTLQFCRYGRYLAAQGHDLIWAVQPELVRLLDGQIPGRVINRAEAFPDADSYIPVLSLPLATGLVRGGQIPPSVMLQAPKKPVLPENSRKIGLIWAGSPTHRRDAERSLPLSTMAPLWENLDASFYAPFLGAALDQTEGTPVQRLDSHIKDFADTAAILKQLEALVTVDTAAAHLAGALGVKTFLLLSSIPDWRWGTEGTKTLWYENTTLVRAASFGDWREAVDVALRKLRE